MEIGQVKKNKSLMSNVGITKRIISKVKPFHAMFKRNVLISLSELYKSDPPPGLSSTYKSSSLSFKPNHYPLPTWGDNKLVLISTLFTQYKKKNTRK